MNIADLLPHFNFADLILYGLLGIGAVTVLLLFLAARHNAWKE